MQTNISPFPPRPQLPVKQIALAVQALIDLLNAAAPDPEMEDDDPLEDDDPREEDGEDCDHDGRELEDGI